MIRRSTSYVTQWDWSRWKDDINVGVAARLFNHFLFLKENIGNQVSSQGNDISYILFILVHTNFKFAILDPPCGITRHSIVCAAYFFNWSVCIAPGPQFNSFFPAYQRLPLSLTLDLAITFKYASPAVPCGRLFQRNHLRRAPPENRWFFFSLIRRGWHYYWS